LHIQFANIKMNDKFKYVKLNYLEELSNGNNEFIIEIINIFIQQVPEFISNMNKFLEDGNYESLSREAHTAKSSALIFNLEETAEILKTIEITASENNIDNLPALIKKADTGLTAACRELTAYIEEIA
jgi:HPt (histidine-containing phosphotransfer) domain-containing protein